MVERVLSGQEVRTLKPVMTMEQMGEIKAK